MQEKDLPPASEHCELCGRTRDEVEADRRENRVNVCRGCNNRQAADEARSKAAAVARPSPSRSRARKPSDEDAGLNTSSPEAAAEL